MPIGAPDGALAWALIASRFVVAAVVAAILLAPMRLSAPGVRGMEILLFGGQMIIVMLAQYVVNLALVRGGDTLGMMAFMKNGVIQVVILMLLYGTFIPNRPRVVAIVVAVMALAPLFSIAMLTEEPEVRHLADLFRQAEYTGSNALFLLMAAAMAVCGSLLLNGLRIELRRAQKYGHYRLIRKLGEGGMGEVYLAEHQLLKRPCALKLIKAEAGSDPIALARFEREVQSAARLSHPNTIEIYDYGHTGSGTFYYVMEYLRGMSLAELVRRDGPLPPGRIIYVFRQVCGGLGEAHRLGLVHRDLKPGNLFLAVRGGEADVAKVLDFGLVKLTRDPGAADISREMTVSGTPTYMAPEQAMGDRSLDARADIYALGAMMYYALTGQPPFTGPTGFAIMMAQARDPVVPPSRIRPDVPADLERVVLRCLAKRPPTAIRPFGPSATRSPNARPPTNGDPTAPRPGGPPRASRSPERAVTRWRPPRGARGPAGGVGSRLAGQADHEAAAAARLALRRDRAAVRRRDAAGDGQAEPYPRVAEPAGRLGAVERLEEAREILGRDAAAAVLHRHRDDIGLAPDADEDRRARGAVLAGVLQQVVEQLAEQRPVRVGPERLAFGTLPAKVGRPLVVRPAADVLGGPGGQVEAFHVGQAGLGLGPGEEQERLDDPPEPDGVVVEPIQDALVLRDGAGAATGDLDRGDQGGQRCAQLVRRLAGELPLPLEGHVQAVEEPVEAAGEVLQLVARPRAGEPDIVERHGAGRLGHERQRGQGPAGEVTPDRRGERPEAQRDQRQGGGQRPDVGLHRLERGPRGQHVRRAIATRPGTLALVPPPMPRVMVPALGLGRPAVASSAGDSTGKYPPSQAVGPLDRRRDVHREGAEVAPVEDHRPPGARRGLDPLPRLVVDGPGHAAALALGAIGEAVQRRLQLLVEGQPQPHPGEEVQARGEPGQRQRQRHEERDRDARDQGHGPSPAAGRGGSPSRYPRPRIVWISRGPAPRGAAQFLDVDVQRVRDEVVVLAPDVPVDPRARQHLLGMAEEEGEQGQLLGRQVQAMAGPLRPLRREVDADVAIRERQDLYRTPATDQGAARASSSAKANGLHR